MKLLHADWPKLGKFNQRLDYVQTESLNMTQSVMFKQQSEPLVYYQVQSYVRNATGDSLRGLLIDLVLAIDLVGNVNE
jgi:hypothetical protein